jgi:hypothetical protein
MSSFRLVRLVKLFMLALGIFWLSSPAQAVCAASASMAWTGSKRPGLSLQAYAVGETCSKAVLVLAVADAKGKPLWATSRLAEFDAMFQDPSVATPAGMTATLKDWLDTGLKTSPKTSALLPAWHAGQDNPLLNPGEEFGFYAAPDLSQEFYEEMRAKKLPVFCFVQGMESESCFIADPDGNITEFGGRTFPG